MKLKTIIIIFIAVLVVGATWGYFIGQMRARIEHDREQDLMLQAHEKQIPFYTKFFILVKQLDKASDGKLSPFEVAEISRIIIMQCQLNQDIGLEPAIILAVMERESAFNPDAVSWAKAMGLMQVIRSTFELHSRDLGYGGFTKELALDPIVNVQVGIRELVRLRKYWLEEDMSGWVWPIHSYFWGIRNSWQLLTEDKRARLPGMEYGKGVLNLSKKWKEKGL